MCLSSVGRVTALESPGRAVVEVDGVRQRASLAVLALGGVEVDVGDWVLVHTGFAVELLDDERALELATFHRSVRAAADPSGGTREDLG